MFSDNSCGEYIAGGCTRELFGVQGITKECILLHKEKEREYYESNKKTKLFDFERKVYRIYREIIAENDRKIGENRYIVENLPVVDADGRKRNAIRHIGLVLNANRGMVDTDEFYLALQMHGRLIMDLRADVSNTQHRYDVCKNCSSFCIRNKACSHEFCSRYQELRKKTKELYNRLFERDLL